MQYYIDLERWQVEVSCSNKEVVEGLRTIFDFRFGDTCHPDKTLLSCSILCNDPEYHRLNEKVDYNGPRVDVSPGVTISYGFDGPLTWLNVTHTAVIAFDTRQPTTCQVWLAPQAVPTSQGPDQPTPCPEAFFYPMLAEWIRSVDACLVHCGAAVINGRAVILSGPPGSGKSTHILRMLLAGAKFLADDLAILYKEGQELYFYPLREVANVHEGSVTRFPELAFVNDAPRREDNKYTVNVPQYFNNKALVRIPAGPLLRLNPDQEPWIKPCPKNQLFDNIHRMAWFASRPEGNKNHFWLLTDWLSSCEQWCVSQGYLAQNLDILLERLGLDPEESK